jgi:DNA-binding beta-propeller fold protein YncE
VVIADTEGVGRDASMNMNHQDRVYRRTVGAGDPAWRAGNIRTPGRVSGLYRIIVAFPILVIVALICTMLLAPQAHADGGAPQLAYVAGTAQGVSVIDIAQQKITSTIASSGDPHMVLLSTDARFLYVAQPQSGHVAIIAAKTGSVFCTASVPGQPSLLAIDGNFNTLYAAGNGASSISEINPTNCAIKRTFQTGGPIYGLAIAAVAASVSSSSGNQLWVSSGNKLLVFDDLKGTLLGSVTIPGGPQYITIPPGATVYVNTRQGSVFAVDLNSHRLEKLMTGGSYGPMDYDANTGEVYVPDRQHNQLVVLSPANAGFALPHEPARTIDLGAPPQSVAITSDGQLGFVALAGGSVAMLDIPGRQLVTTFHVGGNPQFIITGLYPPAIGTTPQQASVLGTIINIAAYIFVIALLIIPILFFRRYAKARRDAKPEG